MLAVAVPCRSLEAFRRRGAAPLESFGWTVNTRADGSLDATAATTPADAVLATLATEMARAGQTLAARSDRHAVFQGGVPPAGEGQPPMLGTLLATFVGPYMLVTSVGSIDPGPGIERTERLAGDLIVVRSLGHRFVALNGAE